MNGDGRGDLLIGSAGAAYVVFGKATTGNIDLASLGNGGFEIVKSGAYESLGASVAGPGDVNGDGRPDLLVGAAYATANGRSGSGAAYVVFGKPTTADVDLASLGDGGFRIDGANAFDDAGSSVAGLGDVNGDGRTDLLIGAPWADPSGRESAGSAYVVFGRASTADVDLASLGDGGFRIDGANAYDHAGSTVAAAGDANGDGRRDLLLGAADASNNGRVSSGSAYVVFGRGAPANVDLASLGDGGFRIDGANALDAVGTSIAPAGDVNGDGHADLLVGMNGNAQSGAYAIFGQSTPANIDLAALNDRGYFASSLASDKAGYSVAGLGDVNGDGRPDVAVGAPWTRYQDQRYAGATHVLYGFGAPALAYAPLLAVAGKPGSSANPTVIKRTGPARFSASPHLPAGLILDPASGVVSGTPAKPERRTTYTVTMTDLAGTTQAPLAVTIRDETAPRLGLHARGTQHLLLQDGVLIQASCNEACSLLASGTVAVVGSKVTVGLVAARATLRRPTITAMKLALSPAAEKRLARLLGQKRHGRATVTVRAVDRAGNATSATRTISMTG